MCFEYAQVNELPSTTQWVLKSQRHEHEPNEQPSSRSPIVVVQNSRAAVACCLIFEVLLMNRILGLAVINSILHFYIKLIIVQNI